MKGFSLLFSFPIPTSLIPHTVLPINPFSWPDMKLLSLSNLLPLLVVAVAVPDLVSQVSPSLYLLTHNPLAKLKSMDSSSILTAHTRLHPPTLPCRHTASIVSITIARHPALTMRPRPLPLGLTVLHRLVLLPPRRLLSRRRPLMRSEPALFLTLLTHTCSDADRIASFSLTATLNARNTPTLHP